MNEEQEEQLSFPNAAKELEQLILNTYRDAVEGASCSMEARWELDSLLSNTDLRSEGVAIIDDFLVHFAIMAAQDIITECSKGDYTTQQLLDIIDDAYEIGSVMRSLDEEDEDEGD
jgi:hypothetical protein